MERRLAPLPVKTSQDWSSYLLRPSRRTERSQGSVLQIYLGKQITRLTITSRAVFADARDGPAVLRAVQRSRLGLGESEMPHADETAVGWWRRGFLRRTAM